MNSTKNRSINGPTLLLDASATLPDQVARVVEIFQEDLQGVAFPDVSTETLEQASTLVGERAAEVESLRKRVSAAQAELTAAKAVLEQLAKRGLAYAKVYAHGNDALTEKLARVHVAEPPRRKKRKSTRTERRSDETTKASSQAHNDAEMEPSLLSAVG